jgi:hypothetical protein
MILDQSVTVGYSQYVFGTKVCECSIFTVKVIIISREAEDYRHIAAASKD